MAERRKPAPSSNRTASAAASSASSAATSAPAPARSLRETAAAAAMVVQARPVAPEAEIAEVEQAFATNIQALADNTVGIAFASTKKDKGMSLVQSTIPVMTNYLLNIVSRLALLAVYVVKVYSHNEKIVKKDADFFFAEGSLLDNCGIPEAIVREVKDCFHTLWFVHMTKDEQARVWAFFKTYNDIIEDWIILGGGERLATEKEWKQYHDIIRSHRDRLTRIAAAASR